MTDEIVNKAAFVHPSATVYGKVTLAEGSSLWPNVVVRAEMFEVKVGAYTNIQDFVMIHVGDRTPTVIGDYCSITHHCTIHGCVIGDNCLVGINATIMDGCVIGDNCIIAGGSFLKEGTRIPDNSIVMGTPGKVTRSANNWVKNRFNAYMYHHNALCYAKGEHRGWSTADFQQHARSEMGRLQTEFTRLYPQG